MQLLTDCQNLSFFFFFNKGARISIFLSETIFIYIFCCVLCIFMRIFFNIASKTATKMLPFRNSGLLPYVQGISVMSGCVKSLGGIRDKGN